MRIILCVFMTAILVPVVSFSGAQQQAVESDRDSATEVAFEYLSDEARALVILARQFPETRLLNRTLESGTSTLLFEHKGQPLRITALPGGQIEVVSSQVFSSHDIDAIAEHHPELLKHVASFPQALGEDVEVELTLRTKVRRQLESKYQLQLRHPEWYELYEAFRDAPLPQDERLAGSR